MTIVRTKGKEYCERLLFPLHSSPSVILFQKLPSDRQQLIIPEFLGPTIYLSFPSRARFIPPLLRSFPTNRRVHYVPMDSGVCVYIYTYLNTKGRQNNTAFHD